jgi:hypothetical protein
MDTSSLFEHLTGVIGSAITIGLRFPNPRAPPMLRDGKIAFAAQRASALDSFNLFHPLLEVSVDGTIYRPRHRGVDFHYDKLKSKLRVSLRFRRAHPGDATVHDFFGLGPLVAEQNEDSKASDASSNEHEAGEDKEVHPATIHLLVGDVLGTSDYLLKVRRVLSQQTHVVVVVIDSENPNFVVRIERILSMTEAQSLYVQYNNL